MSSIQTITSKCIMYAVDDDADHAEIIKIALNEVFHECNLHFFEEGTSMLRQLQLFPIHPNLIILDLRMPPPDGLDLLRILRTDKKASSIPTIVLTGVTRKDTIGEAFELGAKKVYLKPSSFNDYINIFAEIREFWLTTCS